MKAYTDLEQSKKLAEILPLETADAIYPWRELIKDYDSVYVPEDLSDIGEEDIPCWSLSVLLELISPYLGNFKDGIDFGLSKAMNGKWYSAHYIKCKEDGLLISIKTVTGDTAIDAVFKMICWLKEEKYI